MSREAQAALAQLVRLDQAEALVQPEAQDRVVLMVLRELREPLARLDLRGLQELRVRLVQPELQGPQDRRGLKARLVLLEQLERLDRLDRLAPQAVRVPQV